jgi:hypothetical protein
MATSKQFQITYRARPEKALEREREKRMFNALIMTTSLFFLPVALLRKLAGVGSLTAPGEQPLTMLADAKGMASSLIPFIFMG